MKMPMQPPWNALSILPWDGWRRETRPAPCLQFRRLLLKNIFSRLEVIFLWHGIRTDMLAPRYRPRCSRFLQSMTGRLQEKALNPSRECGRTESVEYCHWRDVAVRKNDYVSGAEAGQKPL
jgi:hypothetical protein